MYLIYNRAVYSPLFNRRAWQILQPLNLNAMRRAARQLRGKHDFSTFRASGCEAKHPVRTIRQLTVQRQGNLITLRITADAFLYHMVRNIAGTLVEVGKGKISAADFSRLLAAKNRSLAGPTAPACGLYLERVSFGKRKAI